MTAQELIDRLTAYIDEVAELVPLCDECAENGWGPQEPPPNEEDKEL